MTHKTHAITLMVTAFEKFTRDNHSVTKSNSLVKKTIIGLIYKLLSVPANGRTDMNNPK